MSATKQQPEHALPWKIDDAAEGNQFLHVCSTPRSACVAMSEDQSDADYIVHVANAYPKLVEALRLLKKDADQQCKDEGWPKLDTSDGASTLLRDLGEEA